MIDALRVPEGLQIGISAILNTEYNPIAYQPQSHAGLDPVVVISA